MIECVDDRKFSDDISSTSAVTKNKNKNEFTNSLRAACTPCSVVYSGADDTDTNIHPFSTQKRNAHRTINCVAHAISVEREQTNSIVAVDIGEGLT